ncbi:TraQ conjugal transfer family protein [Bacteroides caecimuris]|uniref:TraQ conjugal transfer family protein n=2 Tax=Bacteroides TaxID=816 RepID=UPI0026591E7B|nr:TraQ conjugal transfer family protein [Bacteroides caecimuris]
MKYMILLLSVVWGLCSCSSDLNIKHAYSFTVKTLPLPQRLEQGETVALEFSLVRERIYEDAEYSFRYFQPDGKGVLTDDTGQRLAMNRLYRIKSDEFTLLYQSACAEVQQLDFVFIDNFGQELEYSVTFQHENKE